MKWAQVPSSNDPLAILIWALMFALEDPCHSMADNISNMFSVGGEIGGDPGWEIHSFVNDEGNEIYEVWVDPRVSGIERSNGFYDSNILRSTTREVLIAYAHANPEKCDEVRQMLIAHNL